MFLGVVEGLSVVRTNDEETQNFRIVALEEFADGGEVAGRFRHLLVLQLDKAVVHPVSDEGLRVISSEDCFGLRDFVLVMRKLQVLPAAVNVEMRSQQFHAHRRALDVLTRTPEWHIECSAMSM